MGLGDYTIEELEEHLEERKRNNDLEAEFQTLIQRAQPEIAKAKAEAKAACAKVVALAEKYGVPVEGDFLPVYNDYGGHHVYWPESSRKYVEACFDKGDYEAQWKSWNWYVHPWNEYGSYGWVSSSNMC